MTRRIKSNYLSNLLLIYFMGAPESKNKLLGLKSFKSEFFPDMEGDNYGTCALVLQYHKPNSKRFLAMNQMDKQRCVSIILDFEAKIAQLKKTIIDSYE